MKIIGHGMKIAKTVRIAGSVSAATDTALRERILVIARVRWMLAPILAVTAAAAARKMGPTVARTADLYAVMGSVTAGNAIQSIHNIV